MLPTVCLRVKPVGKPDAVAPHVRFDERGWETGPRATVPVLDSTHLKEKAEPVKTSRLLNVLTEHLNILFSYAI